MSTATTAVDRIDALLAARVDAGERFFGARSGDLARLCHQMAERFARGGRLLAFGAGAADVSDARHVAVEFVHPVIVGKRALPALALARGRRGAARAGRRTSRSPSAAARTSRRPCGTPRGPAA